MSNELVIASQVADATVDAFLTRNDGKFWNGSSFETYITANRASYALPMVEQGASSGIYMADFPTGITDSGTYSYYAYIRAGGSPAEGDALAGSGTVDWDGSQVAQAPQGSISGVNWLAYVLRGGFKRTDKDTEIYESTSDAIEEMRRRFGFDEAAVDKNVTTPISVLGDFRMNIEPDFGMVIDVIVQDGQNATELRQKTKAQFDALYPDINVTADRGYPKHFTINAGQIVVGPIPDRLSYTYRINYSQKGGAVSSATATVPFTSQYKKLLRDLTLSMLWEIMEQYDKAAYCLSNFERNLVYAVRKERKNKGDGHFNVRPYGC